MTKYQIYLLGEEGIEDEVFGRIDYDRKVFTYKNSNNQEVIIPLSSIKKLVITEKTPVDVYVA